MGRVRPIIGWANIFCRYQYIVIGKCNIGILVISVSANYRLKDLDIGQNIAKFGQISAKEIYQYRQKYRYLQKFIYLQRYLLWENIGIDSIHIGLILKMGHKVALLFNYSTWSPTRPPNHPPTHMSNLGSEGRTITNESIVGGWP
jgi:hypothetical protein